MDKQKRIKVNQSKASSSPCQQNTLSLCCEQTQNTESKDKKNVPSLYSPLSTSTKVFPMSRTVFFGEAPETAKLARQEYIHLSEQLHNHNNNHIIHALPNLPGRSSSTWVNSCITTTIITPFTHCQTCLAAVHLSEQLHNRNDKTDT